MELLDQANFCIPVKYPVKYDTIHTAHTNRLNRWNLTVPDWRAEIKTNSAQQKCRTIRINEVKPKIACGVNTIAPTNSMVNHVATASVNTPRPNTTRCQVFN